MKFVAVLLLIGTLGAFLASPAMAQGNIPEPGPPACAYCGTTDLGNHSSDCPYYRSSGGSGDSSGGDSSGGEPSSWGETYEERIETAKNMNPVGKVFLGPLALGVSPVLMGFAFLRADADYIAYLARMDYHLTEPYWIGPYYLVKGTGYGLYYAGKGVAGYVTMSAFDEDAAAHASAVGEVASAAREREKAAEAERARREREEQAERERRLAERLAEARRQAAEAERNSALRRIMRANRETRARLEAPETRARFIAQSIDVASDEAVTKVRSGELAGSTRDDILFGAFNVGTSAFGLPGVAIHHAGHALVGALDVERELAVLEASRLEDRAARLKSLQKILVGLRDLPPEERKVRIGQVLAEAAPLLAAARSGAGMDEWTFLGKANARRENWQVEAPVLRKRLQSFGVSNLIGVGVGQVFGHVPGLRDAPDLDEVVGKGWNARHFFAALGKEGANEAAGTAIQAGAEAVVGGER